MIHIRKISNIFYDNPLKYNMPNNFKKNSHTCKMWQK